jgi:uncharacterized RDD family membrane protein YckC
VDEDSRWYLEVAGRRVAVGGGDFVIGRERDCDLPLGDGTVSRHHAAVGVDGERVTVRDLGSSNGTFVNGRRLRGEAELAAGDRLRFGRVRLVLGRGAAEAATAGRRFCPSCGSWVAPQVERCPRCDEDFSVERPLSRSEAIAMSEVMPVGEALATPPRTHRRPSPLAWEDAEAPPAPEIGDETMVSPRPVDAETASGLAPVADEEALEEAEAEAAAAARPLFLPAAGFPRRLAALLADAAWLALVALVASFAAGGPAERGGLIAGGLAAIVVWWTVCLVGWSRWGTTPGKWLLRLYVCDLDGRPGVSPGRALLRLGGAVLSLATLGWGFLRAGLAADHRALHDRLAGTYVAYVSPAAPRREPGGNGGAGRG